MINRYFVIKLFVFILVSSALITTGHARTVLRWIEPDLTVEPEEAEIIVGDTIRFQAIYTDTSGAVSDTMAEWSVTPDSLGTITAGGLFRGTAPGECIVEALLDTLYAWVPIKIESQSEDDTASGAYSELVILPSDTVIASGDSVRFSAYYRSENGEVGAAVDSPLNWSILGMPVGMIDSTGLFRAGDPGYGLVQANSEQQCGISLIFVVDSINDPSGNNTITITRDSPNPNGYSVMQTLTEGELWHIGGLPHPMSVLNGGWVFFPPGAISEDIRIHISLPWFARVLTDSVAWDPKGVIGGVSFDVMVNDTIVEPYEFDVPLIVGLIYKRGLLKNLGIDPGTLSLYFADWEDDSTVFDPSGITDVTVDTLLNRIFSSVAHFSTLAIAGVEGSVLSVPEISRDLPSSFRLLANYPNPFNPTTTVSYYLREQLPVRMMIYNLLGQEIKILVDETRPAGDNTIIWNGRDANGAPVSTGIYICQMRVGGFTDSRKMLLLK
ncbi:MAG: T9SS type A sorting domain-containing protein [Candidatus Neomarinimicrobiota bacterium]